MNEQDQALGVILVLAALYLLPTFIAMGRSHHNAGAIAALNILAGWTALGYLAAFVWCLTSVKPKSNDPLDF